MAATGAGHDKTQIVTPFQVFCYLEREKVAQMNPQLKGVAITAILGQMWRKLSDSTKEYYTSISFQLRGTSLDPVLVAMVPDFHQVRAPPAISVIPRRHFGVAAAQASRNLLINYPNHVF